MAATSTVVYRGDIGSLYLEIDKITGDASYPAGGYSIPSSVGIGTIMAMTKVGSTPREWGTFQSTTRQPESFKFCGQREALRSWPRSRPGRF